VKYRENDKDKKLRKWFANDFSHTLLRRIRLLKGELRGINSLDIQFEYPITAIAGKNGAGKSTILALACCAFHNSKAGFKLPKRSIPYYRFSDFFVQHTEEIPPQGIEIGYYIAHNKWKKSPSLPDGIGLGYQRRWKSKGGKWNDYDERVIRNVVFLGIERIVPHSERSQSRSYSKAFKDAPAKGWENKVKDAVGFVLNKTYDKFRYLEHSKYSLPIVQVGKTIYSGLNMGAGENALFEIFSTIYSCGNGALLVMDEIELGLHVEAQKKFVDRLKDVCLETYTQVICTTHSKDIFDCLPYDARCFVESVNGKTKITTSVSSDFAFSKMAAEPGIELDILVEDEVAKALLQSFFPAAIRARVTVTVIGSAAALARQLAALFLKGEDRPTLAIFDGDQKSKEVDNLNHAQAMAETKKGEFASWFKSHIAYLPGEVWPEAWIVQKSSECIDEISKLISADSDSLSDTLEIGLQAGKHHEFFEIAKALGLERDFCLQLFTVAVCQYAAAEFAAVSDLVVGLLNESGKHPAA
jgi:predicted ATPase